MLSTLQASLGSVHSEVHPSSRRPRRTSLVVRSQTSASEQERGSQLEGTSLGRRDLLAAAAALCAAAPSLPAAAIQGSTAGRLPGLGKPDASGYRIYTRPQGKSGGHGIGKKAQRSTAMASTLMFFPLKFKPQSAILGWTEIPTYSFRVPSGWNETPVSIADLGGTEIDVRFGNPDAGALQIVVAPVARFVDIDENADVRIQDLGPPEKIISGFNPEIYGGPLNEDDVLSQETEEVNGIMQYRWELRPHHLVTATAYKNRVFLLGLTANGRQWRKSAPSLKEIAKSLQVPVASAG